MRQGEAEHLASAGGEEGFTDFLYGTAGGDNIIEDDDVPAPDRLRIRHLKTPGDVVRSMLFVFDRRLRRGVPDLLDDIFRKFKRVAAVEFFKLFDDEIDL